MIKSIIITSIFFTGTGLSVLSPQDIQYYVELNKKYNDKYAAEIRDNNTSIALSLSGKRMSLNDGVFVEFLKCKDNIVLFDLGGEPNISLEGFKKIVECKKLEEFSVTNMKLYDNEYFHEHENMKSLTRLSISNTKMTGAALPFISNNTNLKDLYFKDVIIADDAIRYLEKLENLETLILENVGLTDAAVEILSRQKHPKLYMLGLSKNNITDKSIPLLLQMQSLKSLYLEKTKVTDKILKSKGSRAIEIYF